MSMLWNTVMSKSITEDFNNNMQQQQAFYEYRYHYLEVVNDSEATDTHELIISVTFMQRRYCMYLMLK